MRKQTWHFPSRAECTLCHTMPAKFVLGVNTLQMNKDHDYGNGRVANQLRDAGAPRRLHEAAAGERRSKLPRLRRLRRREARPRPAGPLVPARQLRHCHMKWGGGNAEFQLLATLPLKETGTLGVRPARARSSLKDPRVWSPGEPERSMVYHRMKQTRPGPDAARRLHRGGREGREADRSEWIKQLSQDDK